MVYDYLMVYETNVYQNKFVIRKLYSIFGEIKNKKIAILGITYKPGTSILRRSVALRLLLLKLQRSFY